MSDNWRRRLGIVRRLLGRRLGFAAFLLVLMVAAAFAESFGVSMFLPIISSIGGFPAGFGPMGDYINAVMAMLPQGFEMETLLALVAFAFLCKGVLMVASHSLNDYFALRLRDDWSERILDHYLTARYDVLAREKQGALIHNLTSEPLRAAVGMGILLHLLNRLIMTAVLGAVLMVANWQATLGVAAVGGLLFFALRTWSSRHSLRFGRLQQQMHREVTAIGAEAIAAGIEIRLFGAVDRVRQQVAARLAKHTRAEAIYRAAKEAPVQMTEFLVLLILAVALIGFTRVAGLEPAQYAAQLAFFVIVSQRLLTNFTNLLSQRMKLLSYLTHMRFVDEILQNAPVRERVNDGLPFPGLDGDIVFRSVTFAYEPGRDVLRGLSLTIPQGRTTALIGPSGIGKSTVADMLLGLIAPQAGTILLGSRPLRDYSLASLRRAIGYVSQSPVIFNDTVRDNIRFGAPTATDEEVIEAATLARAHDFIRRLPQGYDTPIGDRGATLSGGERQRIAVARVILRRPSVYVFDEATSALDPESEALLRESIRTLAGAATILIIAHSPGAVAGADVVYRLAGDAVHEVPTAKPQKRIGSA